MIEQSGLVPRQTAVLLSGVALALTACAGSESSTGVRRPLPIAELRVSAPESLVVHESKLLRITAYDRDGREVATPTGVKWTTSDSAVATVSPIGVVTTWRRGAMRISADAEGLTATSGIVNVRARVRVVAGYFYRSDDGSDSEFHPLPDQAGAPASSGTTLAIGDTLQFEAVLVDINGGRIDESPATVQWRSSDSTVVSVSASGRVVGRRFVSPQPPCPCPTTVVTAVTAATPDGEASRSVHVADLVAGLPVTMRLAHAIPGLGPVTFRSSRHEPVTLSFGESAVVSIGSGLFFLGAVGIPGGSFFVTGTDEVSALLRPGDELSIFAVGDLTGGALVETWQPTRTAPPDSGLVRFIQGSFSPWAYVVRTGPPDVAEANARLYNCYFDPGDVGDAVGLPPGAFDLILLGKYAPDPLHISPRVRGTVDAGRSVTFVIAGTGPEDFQLVAFPDP